MSEIHWLNDVSAPFTTAADWTGGLIPGTSDDAILDAAGDTPYTVTASASHTVRSIETAASATLAITGGAFTARVGTGSGVNAGVIAIDNGGAFQFAGTLDNTGMVTMASTSGTTELVIRTGGGFLTGGGTVDLASGARDRIEGLNDSIALTNVDGTIAGAGYLGAGSMIFDNDADGVVEASGGDLVVSTGANTIANAGLMQAGAGGTLTLNLSIVDNAGGTLAAASGGRIDLQGAYVAGGAVTAQSGGLIVANTGDSTLDDAAAATTLAGTVHVESNASLSLNGTFSGAADLDLYAGTGTSKLIVGTAGLTLKGGEINLSNSTGNMIVGTGGSQLFDDYEHITGAGTIGDGEMAIDLDIGSVVDATGSKPLTIDGGSQTITFNGTIECSGSGGLTVDGTLLGADGVLFADGGAITVTGGVSTYSGAEIRNATLKLEGGGGFNHIEFTGTTGELITTSVGRIVGGFSPTGGMEIDCTAVPYIAGDVSFVPNVNNPSSRGVIYLDQGKSGADSFTLNGNFTSTTFITKNDGSGGTLIECEADPAAAASTAAAPTSTAHKVAAMVAASASLAPAVGAMVGMAGADGALGRPNLAMAVAAQQA